MDNINTLKNEIQLGLKTAFIDGAQSNKGVFTPQLITNNYREKQKVLPFIERELSTCTEFYISVAFITEGGIEPLMQVLRELEKKGVPGKILTTNYLYFSEPKALKRLNAFENIELKMYMTNLSNDGFHTKGYIFNENGLYKIIVGSSNLTQNALTKNKEWNSLLYSMSDGEYVDSLLKDFEELWESEYAYSYDKFYSGYNRVYTYIKEQRKKENDSQINTIHQSYDVYKIEPNVMQQAFLHELRDLVNKGEKRALLVSATGTGKTYASAFAVRELNPRRMLFLVHREQIARKAMESYRKIFGETRTYGLVSGTSKEFDKDFVFATIWTIAKDETLANMLPRSFSVIVIDEAHHSAAETYQKLMNYFEPDFWLGMTGSPDRPDGKDIYSIFDFNIAAEIRLPQAMEEDLLCPFHYFGLTDKTDDDANAVYEDNTDRSLDYLLSEQRVSNIVENARFYGFSGDRVKGLIFVSRKDEGLLLSKALNDRHNLHTAFLSGDDSQEYREEIIERLTSDTTSDPLDYIVTVNIFNEGVDIPEINQVIFLRPTESPIVFVQQLGRGLRKWDDKEFVVILDFIGNYTNNYMIPIALSGDRSYNKDTVRKYLREGNRLIPGGSTIHFDEISKERIYRSIDGFKTDAAFKREKYFALKNKINRVPTVLDFYEYGEIDPTIFITSSGKVKSFDEYIRKVDKNAYDFTFTYEQQQILEYISQWLINGKRVEELAMLKLIVNGENITPANIEEVVHEVNKDYVTKTTSYNSAIKFLSNEYVNRLEDKKAYYGMSIVDVDNSTVVPSRIFRHAVKDGYFRKELNTLIEYGFHMYQDHYLNQDKHGFVLYEKYFRKDVSRLLNWDKDMSSVMFGYNIQQGYCPIFVTYDKQKTILKGRQYTDEFVTPTVFSWMSRHGKTEADKELQTIIHSEENGTKLLLFIIKNDDEGKDHYYLGPVHYLSHKEMDWEGNKGEKESIVNFLFQLETAARDDIYDYFVNRK